MRPVVVIFGAAVRPDGSASGVLRARVGAALAMGRLLVDPIYMPTGGQGRFGPAEATVMAGPARRSGCGAGLDHTGGDSGQYAPIGAGLCPAAWAGTSASLRRDIGVSHGAVRHIAEAGRRAGETRSGDGHGCKVGDGASVGIGGYGRYRQYRSTPC